MSTHKFFPNAQNTCDICGLDSIFHVAADTASDILQKDTPTNYRPDLYNAKIQTIESMRDEADDEKSFIDKLTQHYVHLEGIIYEYKAEQLAIAQKLRDIGALARNEIREKLRNADKEYKPEFVRKPVKSRQSKKSMSPMDRIIQSVAMAKGITLDEARNLVYSNPEMMNMFDE